MASTLKSSPIMRAACSASLRMSVWGLPMLNSVVVVKLWLRMIVRSELTPGRMHLAPPLKP